MAAGQRREAVSVASLTIGCTAATPIIATSRTTLSILSPLSTLIATVTRTAGSGAAGAGAEDRHSHRVRVTLATRARYMPPRPSNTSISAPTPSRSTLIGGSPRRREGSPRPVC